MKPFAERAPRADERYILLVEDNPGDARLTRHLLTEDAAGSDALPPLCWVQTVEAAVETLSASPGCVAVLLDLGLPDG